MGCFHYGKTTKKLGKGISDDFSHFLVGFWGSLGSPRWKTVCHEKLRLKILLWDDFTLEKMCVTYIEGGQMTKEWFGTCFGHFQALRALPRPPNGPQLFRMDNLVFHENSRRDILQWEDFIMGTPSDIYIENGQRIVWRFEACFDHF